MEDEKYLAMPVEVAQKIVSYLVKQPYQDVFQLIEAVKSLNTVSMVSEEEDVKKDGKTEEGPKQNNRG